MTCTNCGKEITPGSAVTEDSYLFCNALCRYEWKSKGKPTPFAAHSRSGSAAPSAVSDLEFPIDPPGFEQRNMRVQLRYLRTPKLFLDGDPLNPVKSGFFRTMLEFKAVSNFGKQVSIVFRRRPLDQIPEMRIDGQTFLIARPLTRWEYAWMSFPALLIVAGGGLIGGAVGLAALLSNSILMRRIQHPLPRYLLTGGTTAMAFVIFFTLSTTFIRTLNSIGVPTSNQTVEEQLASAAADLNKGCPYAIDEETRMDSISIGPGRTITYHEAIVNHAMETLDVPHVQETIRPSIVKNVKTNPGMESLRKLRVTFVYTYVDKNGRRLFDLSVTPTEYQ